MVYCSNGLLVFFFLSFLFCGNLTDARLVGALTEEQCVNKHQDTEKVVLESKLETVDVVLNNDDVVEISSKPPIADEVVENIGNSEIYEGLSTTGEYEGEGSGYVTRSASDGEGEGGGVYEESSSEMGEVLETDNKERVETVTDRSESKNDTVINLSERNDSPFSLPLQSQFPRILEIQNKSEDLEVLPSDVRVEDFMKSRIAYHNAVSQGVTDKKYNPLEEYNLQTNNQYDDEALEHIGTPERLTMEETMGDVWKDNAFESKNSKLSIHQDYSPDINIDHESMQFLDKPEAYKLTMEEEKNMDTPTKNIISRENDLKYDTSGSGSTTDTTVHASVTEESTTLGEGIYTHVKYYDQNMTKNISASTAQAYPPNSLIGSNFNKSTNSYVANESIHVDNPKAERIYAFRFEKESAERTSNTERDELSDTRSQTIQTQLLRDFEDKSDEDKVAIKSLLPDYPHFKKEKIEPGVLFEDCTDCDFRVLPIRPSQQRDAPIMEEETLPSPNIRFSDLPEGRELKIYSLGLSGGIFLFSYLSEFLSWIQPNEFPVELLRDALRSQITWISLITQSLQVEAGFVACLVAGVLLALAVPVVVLSHACYRMTGHDDDPAEDKVGWAGNCRRRTLVFILQILLVLLLAGMVAMFATNEQLSNAVVQSSDVIQTSLNDVSAFVHNSHLQLHFLVTQSMDQVLQAVYADLDNVDSLLGRPIQRELVRETGIDVALESLSDLTREAKETTQQVDRLMDEVRVVQEMVVSTRDKLSDLRQQVELFRRACGPRDRALCDTIDASGLDVTFRVDKLKSDERLHRMRRMGGVGLEAAAAEAKEMFMSVPSRVDAETRDAREGSRRQLMRQRSDVDDRSLALEQFVREMTSKVSEAKYEAGFWMQDLDQYEYWRWIICLGGGAAMLMIWTMLMCSLCCGCCGSEKAAGPTILVTIVVLCLFSTVLWTVALVGMLVGGHGEVFVCRPLYDEPDFHVISRLVDQPGVFYSEPRGGFIANVIYGNDTLDVPIRHVLEECRENRAIYPTLGLGRLFDVEGAVAQQRWAPVSMQIRAVRANLSSLEVLSPALQDQLSDLLATISVNFTEHRIQMSRPVIGKDMDSFARQLDNVGNQMRDLATASRMETLSTRTRRLIDSHIRPLEGRKDALVYQLTALEVQTGPLQRQVNQSLSHLKTIQFFINSQGESIAQRKSRQYVDRLLSYVEQLRRHVMNAVTESVAPCRPLWDIFNTTRLFLCRHTMDPLNGYWFATMWCLIVLLVATPVCLKLVDYYRAQGSRSSGSPSENLVISEQGAGWSSPGNTATATTNDNW